MRSICCVCLLHLMFSGCTRTAYEQQVFEDAKAQAELNAINFERTHSTPPREPLPSLQCVSIERHGVQALAC